MSHLQFDKGFQAELVRFESIWNGRVMNILRLHSAKLYDINDIVELITTYNLIALYPTCYDVQHDKPPPHLPPHFEQGLYDDTVTRWTTLNMKSCQRQGKHVVSSDGKILGTSRQQGQYDSDSE